MKDYLQPDYYHFSEDSLWLKKIVIENSDFPASCLDLFAGCGVIGIEIANLVPSIADLTSVELQDTFLPFLRYNSETMLRRDVKHHIEVCSVSRYHPEKTFDLIVANPPYFAPEKSRPSPNMAKDICRRFLIDTWEDFFMQAKKLLARNGKCYFLARQEHLIPTNTVNLYLVSSQGDLSIYYFCK